MSSLEDVYLKIRPFAESGKVTKLLSEIHSLNELEKRVELARLIIRKLAFDEWENKDLDVMIAVADDAISACEGAEGEFLQQANLILFNTSANLCDCWGDDFVREPRHFEKGIDYADKAISLRERLNKGPAAVAMPTWAKGKHEQSLGRFDEATESFRKSLALEIEAAALGNTPATLDPDARPGLLIATAYVALMENDRPTLADLDRVLDKMERSGGEKATEGKIIRDQVRITAQMLAAQRGDA